MRSTFPRQRAGAATAAVTMSPSRRVLLGVARYPCRSPVTFGYVCLLLAGHAWVVHGDAAELLQYLSTNLDNLADHPVTALLGSALFFDGTLTDLGSLSIGSTAITLGLGVCCCLAWLEQRLGALRAFGAFLAGHVLATLLTAVVITVALGHGWYPEDVRTADDFGVSYGAQTVLALCTAALPLRARVPWAVLVIGWPLGGMDVTGPLPDFTTVGHLLAALIGFALALLPAVRRRLGARRQRPEHAGRPVSAQ
ncbi:rhomboid-like protein [Kitasatospora sp. NPDC004745]|uniref:rhomboid-like protein n=1 Tax=Kitasatospora sp. NPDC004745 TaxID=3364019 RepID=UPI0036AFE337